jgi:chemotaxis regulatin CheY-phosphate phosphatase CheZ
MLRPVAPTPMIPADFDAIHEAVQETERGRWFLAEYARRNRHADTEAVLSAIGRLEFAVGGTRPDTPNDRLRFDVLDMTRAISRMRADLAAMHVDGEDRSPLHAASDELNQIVSKTEQATSTILGAAEQVQEQAWTLREAGVEPQACDRFDHLATTIYTACSFQDLTAQRLRKVTEVLSYLEQRLRGIEDRWRLNDQEAGMVAEAPSLLQGAPAATVMTQHDVDCHLAPEPADLDRHADAWAAAVREAGEPPVLRPAEDDQPPGDDAGERWSSERWDSVLFEPPAVTAAIPADAAPAQEIETAPATQPAPPRRRLSDLSIEERTRLFS